MCVEPLDGDSLEELDKRLVIPACGAEINDDVVQALRDGSQR